MSIPQEAMAAPPPAGPPGAPPAGAGAPTEQQAFDSMEQERMAQVDAIAATTPQPEKPYTMSLVKKMVDAMNSILSTVSGQDLEQIEFEGEGSKMEGMLPPEVYVPFVIIMSFVSTLEGADKYIMNPEELATDAGLRKATGILKMLAKDKEMMEQLKAGEQPAEEGEEELPEEEMSPEEMEAAAPGEFDEEDEEIMGMM